MTDPVHPEEALDAAAAELPDDPALVSHVLQIDLIELVGGGRTVNLEPGLNIVRGDITTGKTTFVRLLRALLSTVPDQLPPEVGQVRALRGALVLGGSRWLVLRPVTTSRDAPVELARQNAGSEELDEAIRVPAVGRAASYSAFLLSRLALPVLSVPRARRDPSSGVTPVSATDWLGYCIVTGDELDAQIFGHLNPFRDQKRRYVFELMYGFYDHETAELTAELRGVELRLAAMERENDTLVRFLADTPFANRDLLEQRLQDRQRRLADALQAQASLAEDLTDQADVASLRDHVARAGERLAQLRQEHRATQHQMNDLEDLRKQLQSQSARLTRAIVADEWLVDFDFQVCPRCGSDLDQHRAAAEQCYLCLQAEHTTGAPDTLLAEQDRLASQIQETDEVLDTRRRSAALLQERLADNQTDLAHLNADLDARTASFVSAGATTLQVTAEQTALVRADIARLEEYRELLDRHQAQVVDRTALAATADDLRGRLEARPMSTSTAQEHVTALERRLLDYLTQLHIPQLGDQLTVKIDSPTWLPRISGRTFDELSSQGLKTLVNAAHALAQHTVAIDRGLPLPGLLILDGLSANAGREGYDGDRVEDLYRLLQRAASDYRGLLQIIAVDNELPSGVLTELVDHVVLSLSQDDRLIR